MSVSPLQLILTEAEFELYEEFVGYIREQGLQATISLDESRGYVVQYAEHVSPFENVGIAVVTALVCNYPDEVYVRS